MSWVDAGRGRKIQTGKATVLTWSKEREGSADMPLLSFRTLACLKFEAAKGNGCELLRGTSKPL